MANLIGEGFPDFVVSQIEKRQSIYGSINRSNAQLEYLDNRTGWCKLVSSVNVDTPVRGITDTGNELARKYVLFNGTSPTSTGAGGLSGYGLGGTNFGINPMPGIISAEIKTENMGSLKSATVQIKANNRNQFDIIDILYLRLGYSVLLEWGNSNYFNNDGSYVASNPHSLSNEFINGSVGTEYQDIFNTITERRKASCGNYDAIVGKVVNFTWSFEKDGTYTINVMIKSMGDILESLKTNTLLPEIKANTDTEEEKTEEEEEPTEPTSEEVIKSFKNTHEIGKKFYALQQKLAPLTAGDGGISTLTSTQNNVVAFKQTYQGVDEGDGVDQYYVRLGYFLRFVQKALIPQVDDKQVRLIEIDTDTDSNLIYVLGRQMSNNPSICLFKVDVPNGSETVSFAPGVDDFTYSEINGNKYGRIMNVYFNMTYILNQLDSLKDADTGKVSLYDLINCLCEGFNNATGNFNQLYPAVDADRNKIVITDQTVCPDIKDLLAKQGKSTSLATFDVYGYYYNNNNNAPSAGFIRDLSFQTSVSPNLATMITIGATSNGYIPGQDSTALSRMNAGLTDRFKKKVDLEQKSTTPPSKESLFEDYKGSILAYQTFVSQLGGSAPTWNQEAIDAFSNAASSFYEYDQAKQTLSKSNGQADGKSSPNGGFLPFDLRLTLDGLSGMKIYQKYTIDSAFLPSNYPTSLNFLLKGITNTIENNEWITTLESFAIPANPNGSEVGQSAVAIASGNSRDATRGTDPLAQPTSGWPYYSNNDAVPPNIAPPSKGTPPTNTRNVSIGSTIKKEYIPVLNSIGGKTKGLKLLAIAMTNQEGFSPGTRSYRTNNPGNIGNTDAGGNNVFKTLKDGIQTQLKYIEDVAAGKKSAYPVGKNKTITPYYSPEIAKNSKSYQLTPYLPGYKFTPYTGTLEQFVKIYATGARGGNTYLSTIMSFYKKNGFDVTEKTTIAQLIKLDSNTPIVT
jgi:hypothetical protein